MSNYEYVRNWRKRTKQRLLLAFDSKCGICGYAFCQEALDFHHVEPEHKDFEISGAGIRKLSILIEEIAKCVCLCSRCHREVHAGLTTIPVDILRPDVSKIKSKLGIKKTAHKTKQDWTTIDLVGFINIGVTKAELARKFGVSRDCINTHYKKQLQAISIKV